MQVMSDRHAGNMTAGVEMGEHERTSTLRHSDLKMGRYGPESGDEPKSTLLCGFSKSILKREGGGRVRLG